MLELFHPERDTAEGQRDVDPPGRVSRARSKSVWEKAFNDERLMDSIQASSASSGESLVARKASTRLQASSNHGVVTVADGSASESTKRRHALRLPRDARDVGVPPNSQSVSIHPRYLKSTRYHRCDGGSRRMGVAGPTELASTARRLAPPVGLGSTPGVVSGTRGLAVLGPGTAASGRTRTTAGPFGLVHEKSDRRETWFVMLAFLVLPLTSAVAVFAQHAQGDTGISRFPDIVHGHPLTNMLLGIFTYTPVVAAVPLAFLLLSRTGQSAASLGFGSPRIIDDVWPGFGLALLAFVSEFVLLIPLAPLLDRNSTLVNPVPIGNVPTYYLIWGIAVSAMTALAEETFMNGYFMTRLEQLGWSPNRALALSLAVRTSYHVYYGIGFLLTIPFGYFVTRSFQKHRRLNRVIAAHFVFDGALFTIALLAH